jgi:hypothetical protein
MADDLFSIKNEFYLGNYMGAINEAQSGDLELSTPNDERDRDVIVRTLAARATLTPTQCESGGNNRGTAQLEPALSPLTTVTLSPRPPTRTAPFPRRHASPPRV